MGEFIFAQVDFARQATLSLLEGVSDDQAKTVPAGFNNSILWNLGHIYLVQERVLRFVNEPMQIPDGFADFFGMGTKPADWEGQPPAMAEVLELLKEQPKRIREKLTNRLDQPIAEPFAIRTLSFKTPGEVLSFYLYHEGMHVQNIKLLKRFSK